MALPPPLPSPVTRSVAPPPVAYPVAPPEPIDTLARGTTEIAARRWNWGALFLAPWWALAQRAYTAATIYLLIDGVLCVFFGLLGSNMTQNGFADAALTSTTLGAIGFLIAVLAAIPLAILGDAIALKHRTFEREDKFRRVQRLWARWGAALAIATLLPPPLAIGYLTATVAHTPGGINLRLLTAATHGDAAEIRAVLDENRERYGTGATNLELDNAIANAKFSGNAEAVRLLQEEVAKRRQLEGTTKP